jgi:hypothetical protein
VKIEWERDIVHTNTLEGVWSLFKRSIIGSYHQVSVKHLDRYLDEFEFRFNNRENPFSFPRYVAATPANIESGIQKPDQRQGRLVIASYSEVGALIRLK